MYSTAGTIMFMLTTMEIVSEAIEDYASPKVLKVNQDNQQDHALRNDKLGHQFQNSVSASKTSLLPCR